MIVLLAAALALPAAAAPAAIAREGSVLFFRGDMEGAVRQWETAREEGGGSRQFDALLSSALTALGKRDLSRGLYADARRRFTEALTIERDSRSLRKLALAAELAEQARSSRVLKPEELDATEEMDRILTALLLLDRAEAAAVVAASSAPAAAPPALEPAAGPRDAQRDRARGLYERGLERYYAGDYEQASSLFYEATRADPGLDKARRGVALVEAALKRRQGERRYAEALRAFYGGDIPAARSALQETLMLDPGNVKARETLLRLNSPGGAP